jgi:adenosine deaminase
MPHVEPLTPESPQIGDPLDRIPKVELHCHVEGTVRPSTVIELAAKAGRPLPVDDPADLYRYDSLDSFLAVFWLVQETFVTPEDWERIAYESLVDAAADGLRYREMFFTPARHLAAGHDLGAIVAGLTDGIEAAEAESGVRCMLIADIDRAYGPGAGLELVERLGDLRRARVGERVIGVGADSTELGVDLAGFAPAFDLPDDSVCVGPATPARQSASGLPTSPSPSMSWTRNGSTTAWRSSRTPS